MRLVQLRQRARWWLAIALVALLGGGHVVAQTGNVKKGLIWKVEREGRVGWVVGSLHMLTADAYPLPASLTAAFQTADTLMEEADPDELTSAAFAASVMSRALYLDGRTIESEVSGDTVKLIADRGARLGLPLEMLRRMKPWMVATTLQTLELQRGGFDPALGLDVHFHRLARESGKRFVALETGLEQVGFLESLGPQFADALIRENTQSADAQVSEVRAIAAAWQSGDAAALDKLILGSMKDAPAVYESLIVKRNRAWLPKVEACFASARCFIVVGAGHLIGPDGLVSSLRGVGYAVTQQ